MVHVHHPPLPKARAGGADAVAELTDWVIDAAASVLHQADREVLRSCMQALGLSGGHLRILARQVVHEPTLLTSGSSRSTGEVRRLITALRHAGVTGVTAPLCEGCGQPKELVSRTATGGMWCYPCWRASRREPCGMCGAPERFPVGRSPDGSAVCGECMRARRAEPCGDCGRLRPPHRRRDDGKGICQNCARKRRAAPCAVCGRDGAARRGEGKHLCGPCHGATQHPPCIDCGKTWRPAGHLQDGSPVCGSCWQRRQWPPCDQCDRRTPRAAEDDGRQLCHPCSKAAAAARAKIEPCPRCDDCGRATRFATMHEKGVLCPRCLRWAQAGGKPAPVRKPNQYPRRACTQCSSVGPIVTRPDGEDVCKRCSRDPQALCSACGHPRQRRQGISAPTCPRCGAEGIQTCPTCAGDRFSISTSQATIRCLQCRLQALITNLLADSNRQVIDEIKPFINQLARADDVTQTTRWLRAGRAGDVLKTMARGHAPLTHDTLDEAAGAQRDKASGIEHLRRLLVAADVLPARDEYLARLERDIDARLAALDVTDRGVLRRFVNWYTMPRVRRRIANGRDSRTTCHLARCSLTGPTRFLGHLRRNGVPLLQVRQADLERWISDNPGYVTDAVLFLRWARRQGLVPALDLPRQRIQTPREFTDAEHQWGMARRCLTDESLTHRARLVGALVLLYGQTSTAIARLRRSDITTIDGVTHIVLGTDAVALDDTLGTIARELATAGTPEARPRGLARAFNPDGDGWLFPGRGPGKPLGEEALRIELRKLGVTARAGRNTALLTLARDVPPMLLKDLLGVGASTAERWREHAAGQWAAYAQRDPAAAQDSH